MFALLHLAALTQNAGTLRSTVIALKCLQATAILNASGCLPSLATCSCCCCCCCRYFTVREAYEEGIVDKLVPGYVPNRIRKMRQEMLAESEPLQTDKPKFRFKRETGPSSSA